jgi:uncharacterized lipoprotein YmbA
MSDVRIAERAENPGRFSAGARGRGAARDRRAAKLGRWICLTLLSVGVFGCLGRSPEVSHYVLAASGPGRVGEPVAGDVGVLIGPVRLPAYLDRPQWARLNSDGSIELDEYTRWLGGFEENFLRAVAFEVSRRTSSTRVVTHPSKAPFPFDARVRLHVDDLVIVDGGILRVRIRWSLTGAGPDAVTTLHVMEEDLPVVDGAEAAIVAAHDEALSELGRRISEAIQAETPGE